MGDLIYTNGRKGYKKGLFHTGTSLFYMHVSEIIHPNSLLPYVCKKHNVSWPFLRKQQIDLLLQQDTVSLQKQNELRSSRNPGNLPIRFFRVKHEWILAFFFQRVETPQVPVTAFYSLSLFSLALTHTCLQTVVDTRSVSDNQ